MSAPAKGYILLHPHEFLEDAVCFNVLVRREFFEEFKHLREKLQPLTCPFVEEFLKQKPDLIYLGSDYPFHDSFSANVEVLKLLLSLGRDFEAVIVRERR